MPPAAKPKGHWPKGKSRNLPPAKVGHGRTLAGLLRRAVEAGYAHPLHGRLTYPRVAGLLGVDRGTPWKWAAGRRLPPERLLGPLRKLLHPFRPED